MRSSPPMENLDGWRLPMILSCVLAVGLAACGFPRPADVGPDQGGSGNNDFTVTLDATRVRIIEGGSVAISIKLDRNAFTDPVTVAVSGLPAGVTADPLTIAADTGTLTLHAVVGAKQGETALNIIAMAGALEHDSPLSLLTTGAAGTLDQSFGSGGTVAMPLAGHGTAILIQPDSKIVIAGVAVDPDNVTTHFMLTRYLPHGTLDTSFSGGVVTFDPSGFTPVAAALQPNGKILIASSFGGRSTQCLVIRVNGDGSLDNGFGSGGKELLVLSDKATQNSTLDAVLVQPDGKILIAGSAEINAATLTRNALLARLTPTGALDASFGTSGRTVTGMGTEDANFAALALQPDDRIVAVGWAGPFSGNRMAAFARFDARGNLDPTFSGDGFLTIDLDFTTTANDFQDGASVVIQPDGKIVAAGSVSQSNAEDTCIVRLNGSDGSLDTHFGNNGITRMNLANGPLDFATDLALQPDGKFVIVGQVEVDGFPNAYVARLSTNTLLDRSFGGGIVTPITKPVGAPAAEFQAVVLDADGRIVAVGFIGGSPDQLILYRFWP